MTSESSIKSSIIKEYTGLTRKKLHVIIFLSLLLIFLAVLSASIGSADVSLKETYFAILERFFPDHFDVNPFAYTVIWELRLERVLMGVLAGSGLAIAGVVMQAILKNPLASPYTLGIASAASFGASLAIILGVGIVGGAHIIIANAFLFSMVAALLIYGFSLRKTSTETMILAGIAIMYLFTAMVASLQYVGEAEEVQEVVYWMFGSLGRANWSSHFPYGNIGIISIALGVTIPYLFLKSWDFNALGTGDETAKSLGVNVERIRVSCCFSPPS